MARPLEIRDSTDNWSIEIDGSGDRASVHVIANLDREGLLYLANALHFAMARLPMPSLASPEPIPPGAADPF